MIYAVPLSFYSHLKAAGELDMIQDEIKNDMGEAIAKRLAAGQLVEAKSTDKKPDGEREQCYCCGDDVISTERQNTDGSVVWFFRHCNRNDCIGQHPANPSGSGQIS